MPGPIVHLIVEQRLRSALRETPGGAEYASRLSSACDPYAAFGCMGPDYLFFSLTEYGTPLDELVNFIFTVYDALEPIRVFYEDNIEPVVDDIEDAIAAVDQALFQGLFAQLKATGDLASATALNAVAVVATKHVDLFYPFYPKLQQGAAETDWYWVDFLHYRKTGEFCSTMWNLAQGDPDLERYCLGYASHIGTDFVGHPAVNAIVGGPYRTHWHRHKLVENWIDAYARRFYGDPASVRSCLGLGGDDDYRADAIAGSYYARLCEFPGQKLPGPLAKLIVKAMRAVYGGIQHPAWLSAADLDSTYRLWWKWFEKTTSAGGAKKPTPVPPPGSGVITLVNDYVSGFPSFPGGAGVPGGGGGILAVLAALLAFAKWVADVIAHTVDWIVNHAVDILTLPFTEAIGLIKWLLYQLQKALYELYDSLRFLMVLGGYFFPEPEDLDRTPWGRAFVNTAFAHETGGPSPSFANYPLRQEAHGLVGTTEHHLVYPSTARENRFAEPCPLPFRGKNPETFITQWHPYDPLIDELYDCVEAYGGTFDFTHTVDARTWKTPQLGSALQFSARLIAQRMQMLPNLNLDGDRGYGWKTWRAVDPAHIETTDPVDVIYIDA